VTEPESVGGNAPVATDPPALVQGATALPALPPSIGDLARAITDGEQQPLAEAELLTNWFRSGQFHYTLHPPATPPGTDPLVDFLTQSRSGSCEQFAGAYVVLARTLGLPSRVVVGFTAGRYSGPGEVSVRGADAHAWPQVYLGPNAGWVSFEPTPQQPRGEVAPDGVIGPSGVTRTGPVAPPTTAPSATTPSSAPTTVPAPAPAPVGSNGSSSPATAAPGGAGLGTLGWALVGAAAVLTILVVFLLVRRRRRWSPAGRSPDQLALLAQAEVERALRQVGVERPLWQPLDLLFEDLRPHDAEPSDRAASLLADGMTVAATADAALFNPLGTSEERSRAAYDAALRVRKELKNVAALPAGVTGRV
jgi:transglutaminase-like putative cysteine protease